MLAFTKGSCNKLYSDNFWLDLKHTFNILWSIQNIKAGKWILISDSQMALLTQKQMKKSILMLSA